MKVGGGEEEELEILVKEEEENDDKVLIFSIFFLGFYKIGFENKFEFPLFMVIIHS